MGGKRKSSTRVQSKKKVTVPKVFKCPFCAHEGACEVKLDRDAETGTISCRVCGETFQTRISFLSDPVDVYCSWVDELNATRDGGGAGGGGAGGGGGGSGAGVGGGGGGEGDALGGGGGLFT